MSALSPVPYNSYSLLNSKRVSETSSKANIPPPKVVIEPPSNTGLLVIKFTQPVLMPENIEKLTSSNILEQHYRDL